MNLAPIEFRVSTTPDDPAWDTFVSMTPGGHHVQTGMWAQVKAHVGWTTLRVTGHRDGQIVCGAQVLLQPLPLVGSIGSLSKGPISEPALFTHLMEALHKAARDAQVRLLVVQPPDDGAWVETMLESNGFRPSALGASPSATLLIDLHQELEEILSDMKSKTRYNVRQGLKKGIEVREGTIDDIPTLHAVLQSTAERQEFQINDETYYRETAQIFGVDRHFKLFLAEADGEPVSAMYVIAFGDTVLFKRGGWTGERGELRPNEAMHWAALAWAKTAGYRWYNFDGIDRDVATAFISGQPLDSNLLQSVTRFKLGFGSDVRLLPGVMDLVYNPVVRWGYQNLTPRLKKFGIVDRAIDFIRSG